MLWRIGDEFADIRYRRCLERVQSWYTGVGLCYSSPSKLGVTAELLPTLARIVSIVAEKTCRNVLQVLASRRFVVGGFSSCRRPFIKRYSRIELSRIVHDHMQSSPTLPS